MATQKIQMEGIYCFGGFGEDNEINNTLRVIQFGAELSWSEPSKLDFRSTDDGSAVCQTGVDRASSSRQHRAHSPRID